MDTLHKPSEIPELTFFDCNLRSFLSIACVPGIKAGFPSPAADYENSSIDFNRDLICHPESTFYAIVRGDSMSGSGIDEGDIIVVDREIDAEDGDVVVALLNGEFTIKALDRKHKEDGFLELVPTNPQYPRIRVESSDQFVIWGVVIWTIRNRKNIKWH